MFREYSFIPMMVIYFIMSYPSFLAGQENKNVKINSIDAKFIESIDQDTLKLDIDSKSHPAWTGGKSSLNETEGQVARFQKRFKGLKIGK